MEIKRSTNLCSAYLLPLLDLNKFSFGEPSNFINSYLNEDDSLLVVQVVNSWPSVTNHTNFRFDFTRDNNTFYVFELPEKYQGVVKTFREGKYSRFPDDVKALIKKKSGLSWRVPVSGGGVKTAKELLALDKDKELKEHLERSLAVKLPNDAELISIPSEDNFFKLNLMKSSDLTIIQ